MDQDERISKLAKEILDIGKTQLLLNMRFLDRALYQLKPIESEKTVIMTNGQSLYYHPYQVIQSYHSDQSFALRLWLHPLMHCLFLHMFVNSHIHQDIWDLSCDIAVEAMIDDLKFSSINGPLERMRHQELKQLRTLIQPMTAEKIYHYFMNEPMSHSLLEGWKNLFVFDSHQLWYVQQGQAGISNQKKKKVDSSQYESSDDMEGGSGHVPESFRSLWKHISEHMESDLQTFSKEQAEKSGDFVKALMALHRERVDYREFLKKFARRAEVMHVSMDEFDYIFYTYGLALYKDTPLIEPLEYRDDKRIRDFVIVIDTSGSVQGEMVQAFLQKTLTILKQQESFDRQFRLHIIQCDAQVKRDDIITNQQEFDRYIENVELHGFGGTDFRPAFEYVDTLVKNGAFHQLKGLLYFTDGLGTYPQKRPDYLTAFVFVDNDNAYYVKVPSWAISIVLEKEDIVMMNHRGVK